MGSAHRAIRVNDSATEIQNLCRHTLDTYGDYPLTAIPRDSAVETLTIRQGYIPLLVNYTFEDEEAKGLRSLRESKRAIPRAVYFSALERLAREPLMVLLGGRGSGKTAFALHVALNLAGEAVGSPNYNISRMCNRLPRGEHGEMKDETWTEESIVPLYLPVAADDNIPDLIERHWPGGCEILGSSAWENDNSHLLLIIDGADRLGPAGEALIHEAVAFAGRNKRIRVLVTAETAVCDTWTLPAVFTKRQLLPLSEPQRRHAVEELLPSRGVEITYECVGTTGHPGLFYCAAWLTGKPKAFSRHALADRWLTSVISAVGLGAEAVDDIVEEGFRLFVENAEIKESSVPNVKAIDATGLSAIFGKRFFLEFMAARHLETKPPAEAAALFLNDPEIWAGPTMILAQRLVQHDGGCDALIEALTGIYEDARPMGALMAARILSQVETRNTPSRWRDPMAKVLFRIVTKGELAVNRREETGRHLSRWGDPRDLLALAEVPGGVFTMGSVLHPNSDPPHHIELGAFRIGKYPVTNALYLHFIEDTERVWLSEDGRLPERANAPAVDLTWHDARACCDWLTEKWRREGRIGTGEAVRLPTEPEWERAARGDQPATPNTHIYPWRGDWEADRENSEESGFNDTCVVGLFPEGRSPYGCFDMGGQIWEWTTTLWGEDMASPSFRYPYRADGREDAEAGPTIRRVLRGGCFSSAKEKACCTYRGSLEPNGFWRGNGFRVVVASRGK